MQRAIAVAVLIGTISLPGFANPALYGSQSNGTAVVNFIDTPHIVERSGNSRVWEHTAIEKSPRGKTITKIHAYTEIATGICYNQDGQWIDADPQIVVGQDGTYSGVRAATSLRLSPDIATDGSVQFISQNGKQLRGHVLGLCYYDWKNQRDVQVAGVQSSVATIIGKSQVLYPSAFGGVEADVRYTFRKSGFGQDIILREQLPSPVDFGLDPATTQVEVWTEFLNPPEPAVKDRQDKVSGQVFHDIMDFGGARMGRGAAFSIPKQNQSVSKVGVNKQWQQIEGRTFLIESVDYESLLRRTSDLPQRPQAAVPRKFSTVAAASTRRNAPHRLLAINTSNRKLRVAAAKPDEKGFVLDYEVASGEVTNYTFLGSTNYYVSGEFDVDDTLTIEGNTC